MATRSAAARKGAEALLAQARPGPHLPAALYPLYFAVQQVAGMMAMAHLRPSTYRACLAVFRALLTSANRNDLYRETIAGLSMVLADRLP